MIDIDVCIMLRLNYCVLTLKICDVIIVISLHVTVVLLHLWPSLGLFSSCLLTFCEVTLMEGARVCVCVADRGKMSWNRGCRLCKRAGENWWCSWRGWWSCSRWHTDKHRLLFSAWCIVTLEDQVSLFPLHLLFFWSGSNKPHFSLCYFSFSNFTLF